MSAALLRDASRASSASCRRAASAMRFSASRCSRLRFIASASRFRRAISASFCCAAALAAASSAAALALASLSSLALRCASAAAFAASAGVHVLAFGAALRGRRPLPCGACQRFCCGATGATECGSAAGSEPTVATGLDFTASGALAAAAGAGAPPLPATRRAGRHKHVHTLIASLGKRTSAGYCKLPVKRRTGVSSGLADPGASFGHASRCLHTSCWYTTASLPFSGS